MSGYILDSVEAAAAAIVEHQGGRLRRGGALCRCPAHRDTNPSLSVRVGDTSVLFKCFAGCSAGEVLRALRQARLRVPIDRDRLPDTRRGLPDLAARGRAIWDAAKSLGGSNGERYLHGRGIDLPSEALRFHPTVPLGRGRGVRFRPAIVAAVTERRRLVAIQRLFLEPYAPLLARDLNEPRMMLGRPHCGAVRLLPAGPVLGLAEGVETALSAAMLLRFPVWATLGSERFSRIGIPAGVRRLVLLPDADPPGVRAERQARIAYAPLEIEIETVWPWYGCKDWNDVLRKEGREDGAARGWLADLAGAAASGEYR